VERGGLVGIEGGLSEWSLLESWEMNVWVEICVVWIWALFCLGGPGICGYAWVNARKDRNFG
jgi:hypothetical protein